MKTLFSLLFTAFVAIAQPNIGSRQLIGNQYVYADIKKPQVFYYLPGKLKLLTETGGKPIFQFVEMRYMGTRATADQGKRQYRNLIQFDVGLVGLSKDEKNTLLQALKQQNPQAELLAIPIWKADAFLVYQAISDTTSQVLSGGNFQEKEADNGLNWTEKTFSLQLDNHSAQLFWQAFHEKQTILSVAYAFYTKGIADAKSVTVSGSSRLRKQMDKHFQGILEDSLENKKESVALVLADAFEVSVDTKVYPDLLKQIDLNESGNSAKYPLLDIYCFDFNNELRTDLFLKKIEVEAQSVANKKILTSVDFKSSQAQVFAKTLRFAYPVKMDYPFRYKITEISAEGEKWESDWAERKSWAEILDITSPPEKHKKPISVEEN